MAEDTNYRLRVRVEAAASRQGDGAATADAGAPAEDTGPATESTRQSGGRGGLGATLRGLTPGQVSRFVFLWLLVGFFTGTLTLLGPVRWLTDHARASGWGQGAEDWAVRGVIVVFVLGSALVALLLARIQSRASGGAVRFGIPVVLLGLAGGAVWIWMSPGIINSATGGEVVRQAGFTFGPYPDRQRMEELRLAGYTAVVSLLHPAVVPFEPKLLADEEAAAREVGLELIHAPMLPWVGSNEESLERIRRLALDGDGRYYVHCYLGRDRVRVVQELVARVTGGQGGEGVAEEVRLLTRLEQGFERGPVMQLEEGVFLTPFPTDEEMFLFFAGGGLQTVVSLLDPGKPADVMWIERETGVLERFGVPLEMIEVPDEPFEPERALRAAQAVKDLPRPLAVHAFLTNSVPSQGFLQAYVSGLPPLPPLMIERPMSAGQARAVAPNVATGPRPEESDWELLRFRGVRHVAFVGSPQMETAQVDRLEATAAQLRWSAFGKDRATLLEALGRGGPWYLYGAAAEEIAALVTERQGPPVPEGAQHIFYLADAGSPRAAAGSEPSEP